MAFQLFLKQFYIISFYDVAELFERRVIVEINKSQFYKRKYNVGRAISNSWAIDGIDVETRDAFFVEVFTRSKEVLTRVVSENVEVSNTIYTD
jgi:hypothetical protein